MALQPEHRQEEWYQQMINAATGKYLPSITSQDAGKVMTVESDGSWGVENVPTELPSVSGTDEGKVLTVNNSGVWGASGNIVLEGTRSGEDVTITTSPLPSHDAFVNAYKMGRGITLVLNDVETIYLLPFEQITSENSVTFYGIGIDFDYRKCAVYIHEMNGTVNVQFTSLDKFIVTLTPTSPDYSGTMDKTVAEINAAYEAGQQIWFEISDGNTTNRFAMTMIYRDNSAYPSFTGYIIYHDMIIDVATGSTNLGTSNTYNTIVYPITPAT